MKRIRDTDKWTRDDVETAAIAEMLHVLLFFDDPKKTTGLFPRKKLLTKMKRAFEKGKELFCQKFRCYTHRRYI